MLWQRQLVYPAIVGETVVGLTEEGPAARIKAVSALTGQPRWSVPTPAEPQVLGVSLEGSAVIVEAGRGLDDPAGTIVVKEIAVYSLADGCPLWRTPVADSPSHLPGNRLVYAAGTIVMAGPDGELVARRATTGAVVWRASRPRSCPSRGGAEDGTEARVSADGTLLVVSYQCVGSGRAHVLVERRSPTSGNPIWKWQSVSVRATAESFIGLSVVDVASAGNIVLLSGQVSNAGHYVRTLPNARGWPTALGPEGSNEMLLALDARDGRPRWNELGGQLPELALADGVVCEFHVQGVECRDDSTGRPSRPLLKTGLSELESGPNRAGDETAGVADSLAAVALKRKKGEPLVVEVAPLRGSGKATRVLLWLGPNLPESAHSTPLVVRAGTLANGATLLLLRRIDVPEDPLLALRVRPARNG